MSADVTVVIPTHNRAMLVAQAVRSVLAQTLPAAEIIVVDDASEDDTQSVLRSFGDRITVITSRENIERAAARNLGASRAATPYVAFLDSDDEWTPEKLQSQAPLLAPGVAVVTGIAFIDQSGEGLGTTYTPPVDAHRQVQFENPYLGAPSSLVIDRSTFLGLGGFPEEREVQGSEDWLFLISLVRSTAEIRVIDKPLVRYRVHGSNATAEPASLARSMWSAVRFMEDRRLLDGSEITRTRTRTATVIARSYAARGKWPETCHWAGLALRSGTAIEAARGLMLIGATAAKTVLTGRGSSSEFGG